MTSRKQLLCFLLLLTLLVQGNALAGQAIRPGAPFPALSLSSPQNPADRQYLQIAEGEENFNPSQIDSELLLVELLNVHCPHCQLQAPIYNALFKRIEADPENRAKLKLLGIAVGNLPEEVESFRTTYQVEFPLLADPDFAVWGQIGGQATPMTIYVRLDKTQRTGVVAGIHLGLNPDYRLLYQNLLAMAAEDPAELRRKAAAGVAKRRAVKPILSAELLEFRVRSAFTRFGIIADFSELALLSGRKLFSARMSDGQQLFAEVVSHSSVCDLCHDVHFIYLFDRSSRVIAFDPLQLTKYGNAHWNEQEVEMTRNRLLGRYLSMPQPFDPSVDAVSSATMTSAIIFNSLNQGEELISELRGQGLL